MPEIFGGGGQERDEAGAILGGDISFEKFHGWDELVIVVFLEVVASVLVSSVGVEDEDVHHDDDVSQFHVHTVVRGLVMVTDRSIKTENRRQPARHFFLNRNKYLS